MPTSAGVLAALLLLAAACPASAEAPRANLNHVVLCWLREPGNEAHRDQVVRATRELLVIPEIRSLAVGVPVPSDRPIVDDSFDVGLVMTFQDRKALNTYLEHPEHIQRVTQILQPLCGRVTAFDIMNAP